MTSHRGRSCGGRQQLSKFQCAEIACVRAMLAPYLLILRGAAWIDPETLGQGGRIAR